MNKILSAFILLFSFTMLVNPHISNADKAISDDDKSLKPVYVLKIDDAIGPASADYIIRSIKKAQTANAELIVLEINTPGGLMDSMRDIITEILASKIPVATYVSPPGSHAASAGTFILYGSHIAAMAPGTNIGAASPVQMGGGSKPAQQDTKQNKNNDQKLLSKIMNDSVAYIRGLADMHGRNADWAEEAVRDASSIGAKDAKTKGVIDVIATDIDDLMLKLHLKKVKLQGETITLSTKDAPIVNIVPDWRTEILSIITNPNVAFLLMTLGAYGLIYEFSNPGAFVPGVIGVICLMLGLFALNVLPINYAGLVLIFLGMGFMVGEAFIPSFGILGIGGLVAFMFGATMLIDSDIPGFGISIWAVLAMGGLSFSVLTLALTYTVKAQKNPVTTGQEELLNSIGIIKSWADGKGKVKITGETWQVFSADEEVFEAGDKVKVLKINGLKLQVTKNN